MIFGILSPWLLDYCKSLTTSRFHKPRSAAWCIDMHRPWEHQWIHWAADRCEFGDSARQCKCIVREALTWSLASESWLPSWVLALPQIKQMSYQSDIISVISTMSCSIHFTNSSCESWPTHLLKWLARHHTPQDRSKLPCTPKPKTSRAARLNYIGHRYDSLFDLCCQCNSKATYI